jgi:hypothetical protein
MKWLRRLFSAGLTLVLLAGVSCTTSDSTLTGVSDVQPAQQPSLFLDDLVGDLGDILSDDDGQAPRQDAADGLGGVTGGLGNTVGGVLGGALGAVSDVTDLLTCSEQMYVAVQETIGRQGGRIRVGEHTLDIPEGALDRRVRIKAEQLRGSTNSVRFSPEGLRFERPATLTLSYNNCSVVLLPKSIVYTTEKFKILEVLRSIDLFRKKTVTAPIDHFSRYAVAY